MALVVAATAAICLFRPVFAMFEIESEYCRRHSKVQHDISLMMWKGRLRQLHCITLHHAASETVDDACVAQTGMSAAHDIASRCFLPPDSLLCSGSQLSPAAGHIGNANCDDVNAAVHPTPPLM